MKNSIKLIAAAALVATSGFASAAINNGSTGDGELFFMAYDSTSSLTYVFDTGVLTSAFQPLTAATQSFALTGFASFMATASMNTTAWGVFGVSQAATGGPSKPSLYATTSAVPATGPNQSSLAAANAILVDGPGAGPIAAANLVTPAATQNGFAILAGNQTGVVEGVIGTVKFPVTGAMNESLSFVKLSNPTISKSTVTTFANAYGVSSWSVDTASKTLNFTAATAPVPEPSTYALAIAGLAVVGALARRKKAAK
ncbi:MAG: hypothetical protein RJA98_2070 [Pseudomonadota bacterium]|jgi:hypothetical protein